MDLDPNEITAASRCTLQVSHAVEIRQGPCVSVTFSRPSLALEAFSVSSLILRRVSSSHCSYCSTALVPMDAVSHTWNNLKVAEGLRV